MKTPEQFPNGQAAFRGDGPYWRGFLRHPVRGGLRAIWLVLELVYALVSFGLRVRFARQEQKVAVRKQCITRHGRRLLRVFNFRGRCEGAIPTSGLVVSNHLSYLDIVFLGSVMSAVFVSKKEVQSWPLIGPVVTAAGTLYVDREKRTEVARLATEIKALLDAGNVVVFFPEGTSSDGESVLPFKSSLLEPAVQAQCPVIGASVHYHLPDGDAGQEVCYWREMTFAPHLLNLLTKKELHGWVKFGEPQEPSGDRKELARRMQATVAALQAEVKAAALK